MAKLIITLALLACLFLSSDSASVSTQDVASAVNSMLSSLPELMGDKAPVPHTRSLLQSDASTDPIQIPSCIWDWKHKQCGLNPLVAVGFLSEAPKSHLRDLIVDVVRCGLSFRKDICKKSDKCIWVDGQCGYVTDVTDTETISDCIGRDSAAFLDSRDKEEECRSSYDTEDSCNIAEYCTWHSKDGDSPYCKFDAWKLLTGVPSDGFLPRGIKKVTEERGEVLTNALKEAGIKKAADILSWELPPFKCPDGIDLVVCHTAEQADELIVTQLYCAALAAEGDDCDSDKLCSTDGTDTCSASLTVFQEVAAAQLEAYLSAISDPTAADLLRREVICLSKTGATCTTDSCVWDAEDQICSLNPAYMMKKFAERPVERPGALCQLVTGIFESGCLQLDTEEACATEEDAYCQWDSGDGICVPGPQVYMDILFSDDEILEKQAAHMATKCQEISLKDKCK